jgi:hypothetical protein
MIGFIGVVLQLHFQLQSLITVHNQRLPETRSVSFLGYNWSISALERI